ncbi:MAG: T9SS type A sorting domain-containing protein [Bacteroidota bacterium]
MKKKYISTKLNVSTPSICRILLVVLILGSSLNSFSQMPPAPTWVNCSAVSTTQINASWEACTSAYDYYVQIDDSSTFCGWGIGSGITHVYAPTITHSFTGLIPNHTYYIHVAAVNNAWAYHGETTSSGCATLMSVEENINNTSVNVYPNPMATELLIEIKENSEVTHYELLNSLGEIVLKGDVIDKKTISTSNLSAGVYLMKLENGKNIELRKLIKE